ncbi:unnamed protein product [Closterium sp. Yama58-4]|nr:unnamed protein product [Closterium sp. Yama58-4]
MAEFNPSAAPAPGALAPTGSRPQTRGQKPSFPRSASLGAGGKSSPVPPTASSAAHERDLRRRSSAAGSAGADLGARVAAAAAAVAASVSAANAAPLVAPTVAEPSVAAEAAEAAAEAAAAAAAQRIAKARELMERLHQPTAHEMRQQREEAERREKARQEMLERQQNEERRKQELVTRAATIIATAGMPGAREFRAEQERREEERRAQELREQEEREAEERRRREEEERRQREEEERRQREERRQQLKNRAATIVANAPSWEQALQQQLKQQDHSAATAGLLDSENSGVNASESSPVQLPRRRPLTLQIDDAIGDCNAVTVASSATGPAKPPRQCAVGAERSPRSAPLVTAAACASAQAVMAGAKSPGSISRGAARSFGSLSPTAFLPPKSPAAPTWGAGAVSAREEVSRPDVSRPETIKSPKGAAQLSSSSGGRHTRSFHGQQQSFHGQNGEPPRQRTSQVKKSVSFPDMACLHPSGLPVKAAERSNTTGSSSVIHGGNTTTTSSGFSRIPGASRGASAIERSTRRGDSMDFTSDRLVAVEEDEWGRTGMERRRERRRGGSEGCEPAFADDWTTDRDDVPVARTLVASTAVASGWEREISLANMPLDSAPPVPVESPRPPFAAAAPADAPGTEIDLHDSPPSPSPPSPLPLSPSPHTLPRHPFSPHSPSPHSLSPHPPSQDASKPYGTSPIPPAFHGATRKKDSLPPLSPTCISPHAPPAGPASKARHAYPRSKSSEAGGSAPEGKSPEPEYSPGWDGVVEVNRVQSIDERVRGSGRACAAEAEDSPCGRDSSGSAAAGGDGKARVGSERVARRGLVKHASSAVERGSRGNSSGDAAGEGSGRGGGRGAHRRAATWADPKELSPAGREDGGEGGALSRRSPGAATAAGTCAAEAKADGSGRCEPIQNHSGADSTPATCEADAEADERGQWEEAELHIQTRFFKASRNRLFSLAAKGLSSFSKLLAAAGAAAAGAAAGMGVGVVGVNVLGGEFGEVEARYEVEGGKELGAGQFGVTRVVVCRSTGRRLACKTIKKAAFKSKSDIENVRREVAILNLLKSHPNVIHLEEPIETPQAIHLIMELCTGGELFDRIKERRRYSEREAALVMRAVLGVLHSCHHRHHELPAGRCSIVHRDIKPENILLASPTSHTDVRVIDFGVATFLKPGGKPLSDAVGSLFYIAPEVIAGSYGTPADVWSAGVVLYVLLAGVPPFWAETEAGVARAIKEAEVGFKGSAWRGLSEEGKDLILKMLDRDQKRRVSAQEALAVGIGALIAYLAIKNGRRLIDGRRSVTSGSAAGFRGSRVAARSSAAGGSAAVASGNGAGKSGGNRGGGTPKRSPEGLKLVGGNGEVHQELTWQLPSLQEPYRPFFGPLANCHVETIFAAVARSLPAVRFRRECLRMADGGTVALDWPVGGEALEGTSANGEVPPGTPWLILLAGRLGHSGLPSHPCIPPPLLSPLHPPSSPLPLASPLLSSPPCIPPPLLSPLHPPSSPLPLASPLLSSPPCIPPPLLSPLHPPSSPLPLASPLSSPLPLASPLLSSPPCIPPPLLSPLHPPSSPLPLASPLLSSPPCIPPPLLSPLHPPSSPLPLASPLLSSPPCIPPPLLSPLHPPSSPLPLASPLLSSPPCIPPPLLSPLHAPLPCLATHAAGANWWQWRHICEAHAGALTAPLSHLIPLSPTLQPGLTGGSGDTYVRHMLVP